MKTFVYLMHNLKPLTNAVVARHVDHLRALDDGGRLVFSGPFEDQPGGMVILLAESSEDAVLIADRDPFMAEGYKTYELITVIPANRENNYLLENNEASE